MKGAGTIGQRFFFLDRGRVVFLTTALLLAFAISFVNGFHHPLEKSLLAREGLKYSPYSLVRDYDATNVIGPRIKDVLDGRLYVSDIDLYEYRTASAYWPPLPPLFFYPFSFFTHSVTTVVILTDFIVPPILFFLLATLLFFLLGRRKWMALCFAAIISLFPYAALYLPPSSFGGLKTLVNTLNPFASSAEAFFLTRRESFIPALIPFFSAIIAVLYGVITQRRVFLVLAGILVALNAYSYPFHFIYLGAALAIYFVLAAVERRTLLIKDLLIIAGTAFVALIPFLITQYQLHALPQYADITSRFGIEVGRGFRFWHAPRYIHLLLLAAIVYGVGKRKGRDRESLLVTSFLLAGIFVINMNMFLGYSVQSDHWVNRSILWGITFGYALVGFWILDFLIPRLRYFRRVVPIVGGLIIISLFMNGVRVQTARAKSDYHFRTIPASLDTAFTWLEDHTPTDSVVLTPSLITNYFIPVYTHNKIFAPRTLNTLAPESEIIERLLIAYHLFVVPRSHLEDILKDETSRDFSKDDLMQYELSGSTYLFAFKYKNQSLVTYTEGFADPLITEEVRRDILNQFDSFSCGQCLSRYRADYLFVGPYERLLSSVNFSDNPLLTLVYDTDGVKIYKFTR